MNRSYRLAINIVGLLVFAVVLVLAIYASPPRISELDYSWLLLATIAAAAAILVQAAQTVLFLQHEKIASRWRWATWFTAEKAWMNSVFPAKAGTAGAVVLLRGSFGVAWDRYLRFMALCGGLAASSSVAGALFLLWPSWLTTLPALLLHLSFTFGLRLIYRVEAAALLVLSALSFVSLVALTVGVGACVHGLGYTGGLSGIIPIGITLNLLSIVSLTPGNFGIRESVLALLSPAIPLSFATVIQASTCYVFIRLLTSLVIASLLRTGSLEESA